MNLISKCMDLLGRRRVITERDSNMPYLVRYYVFLKERNRFPFNITLHKVLKSDECTLHDHPWSYATFIIKGGYWEFIPVVSREGFVVGATAEWRGPGHFRRRPATDLHYLTLDKDEHGNEIPCWSLFFMGKKAKDWGFMKFFSHKEQSDIYKQGYQWVSHTEYLARGAKDE